MVQILIQKSENEAHEIRRETPIVNSSDNNEEQKVLENECSVEGEVVTEIIELKQESVVQVQFEKSLEQFFNHEDVESTLIFARNPSTIDGSVSEALSRLSTETELHTNSNNRKKTKSKFKIPKPRSLINLNNVKPRYLDVFKKN